MVNKDSQEPKALLVDSLIGMRYIALAKHRSFQIIEFFAFGRALYSSVASDKRPYFDFMIKSKVYPVDD